MTFGDQFLKDPAGISPLSDTEPWGNERLTIDFVGGPYLITGLSKDQAVQLRCHFEESCRDTPPADNTSVHIQLFKAQPSDFKEIETFPWELTFDIENHVDYLNIAGLHVVSQLNFKPCLNAKIWTSKSHEFDFPVNIFENIFRIIVTYHLHDSGGMLVHSACVIDNESAVLFPGRSNDGKSTLSRMSLETGRTVLSDDMNALVWVDDKPVLEKVPFAGDLGSTWARSNQYPLKGIFSIHKTETTVISPMSTSQTVALMVASAPFLNTDKQRIPDLLASVHRFAESVPTGALGFSIGQDYWPEIQKYLSQQETR